MDKITDRDDLPPREQFAEIICGFERLVRHLFMFYAVMLLGGLLSWSMLESGTASAVVVQVVVAINLLMLVMTLMIGRLCARHNTAHRED